MYKCTDCGHIFDEGEWGSYTEHHPYGNTTADETFLVCPVCGGDFEETTRCLHCEGEFLFDELLSGYYCFDCVESALDYDSFLDFATSGVNRAIQIDTLEDFIFSELFHVDTPKRSSSDLKAYCREIYLREVANDRILQTTEFMEKIKSYFSTISSLWDEFAEYLHAKSEKERSDHHRESGKEV